MAATGASGDVGDLARHASSPFYRAEVRGILAGADTTSGRLLDVGCGNGGLAAEARIRGLAPVGVDAARTTLEGARGLHPSIPFVQARVERLPFRTGSADVLTAQHILEHLADPAAAVREWRRILRPGGRLVVLTPNARYPDLALFRDPTHVRLFDRRSLVNLLRGEGFELLRTRTLFPFLGGHIVFGLRFRGLFSRLPPWASTGRSLLCVARRPVESGPHG